VTLSRATLFLLRGGVLFLCSLHAFFNPLYEGPDEPFHLARARAFTQAPLTEALAGRVVDADLVRSMRAWPCGPAMQAAFDCPAFGSEPATFNILKPSRRLEAGASSHNYQAHQPPLYYLTAASLLALFAPGIGAEPETQVLLLRLGAVVLVGFTLCFPLRKLGKRNGPLEALVLLALLLPGAAESLIRVSNDVGVFAWSVLLLAVLHGGDRLRPGLTALLAGVGPMLKLTALPMVAFAAVYGWRAHGRRVGLTIAAAGLAVFPLQWLRGWAWGGTLEANARLGDLGGVPEILAGLGRSALVFLKTSVWLGGWSFHRPPGWLLIAAPLFALLLGVRCLRLRPSAENGTAHLAATMLALAGFIAFALGQRQIFGSWSDLFELRPGRERELVGGALAAAAVLNVTWFEVARRLYG
jgi:hypothetical protein